MVEIHNPSYPNDYSIIRQLPSPIVLVKAGTIREMSLPAVRLLGGDNPDRYVNMDFCDAFQILSQDRESFQLMCNQAVNNPLNKNEVSKIFQVKGPDNSPTEIQLSFSSHSDIDPNMVLIGIKEETGGIRDMGAYGGSLGERDAIFKNNPALMLILDPSSDIIDVNNAWVQKSGYSREQLLSMNLTDLTVISRSGDTIDHAIREKRAISGDMVLDTPNGRLALVYHYTPVFSSANGNTIESLLAVYFDVTENRNLQKKNQLMIDKNPTLFFILDKNLQVIEANPAWEAISGYTRQQLLSMKLTDFSVYERNGGNIMDTFTKGVEVTGELGVIVPKGRLHLQYHYVPFVSEDGQIDEILAAYFDVTALHALAQRNRLLIQKNPTLFFILDKSLQITEANPAWEAIAGYSMDQLLSMKLTDFKVYERSGGNFMDAFTKGVEVTGELGVVVPNGKLHLQFHYVPLPSEDGQINEILAAYFDISSIKALEKKNQMIIENNPGLIFILDKDLRIIRANKTWVDLSGYSLKQILSMKLTDFKILERKGEDFRLAFTKGVAVTGELLVETPKKKLYLTAHYLPLPDEDGKIEEVLAVYFDITTIRELEQKLQKSIGEIADTLSDLANKNLSVSTPIYDEDPLIGVKTDLNSSISAIHEVLVSILSQSQSLTQSIEDISKATVDLTEGSQQVALISQQAEHDISEQLQELVRVSNDITDLSASIEEISASAQDVQKLIAQIAINGNQAVHQGEDATEKMKIVEKISREATDQIITLNNRMNEVGKIVQMIGDIANQTNLLALNAAIEAARAGEHGRGFAVVAGEVKNLAGESKLATGKIGDLISTLMKESELTAESMKNAFESIISGTSSVGNALSSLNQIAKDIEIAEGNVSEITRATENQAEATNRVTQNVGVIQQMVTGEEQKMTGLAAVAEESSAATEEIASASGEISDMAKELKKEVERFSL
ncbi:methyl-accepting chemotaxis protein [Methanospirillum sp.]